MNIAKEEGMGTKKEKGQFIRTMTERQRKQEEKDTHRLETVRQKH